MHRKYNIAIAGATGNVGREILSILDERNFPIENLYLLASSRSKGKKIIFKGNKTYKFPSNIRSCMENFIFKRVGHHKISKIFNDFHIHCVKKFIKNEQLNNKAIKVIGFHGHTIYHNPIENWTWQLGDGKYLSKKLKIPVVSNFRYRDVCLGGEGAPLVPVWHHAIINMIEKKEFPCAFINIGGVSNITLFSNIIDTVSYTHLTLPTKAWCRSRWSPYH